MNFKIAAAVFLIIGIGAFMAGTQYQKNKISSQLLQVQRQGGFRRAERDNASVRGEILAADSSSFTIKMKDGSSKIVLLSGKVVINKAVEAQREDLKVGDQVMAIGSLNADGSITAKNVQLGVTFREGNFN